MTPQEWLVRWMELKAEYAEFPKYFNEEDKKQLLSLSTEKAKKVAEEIIDTLRDKTSYYFFSVGCPFCILVDDECDQCSYGERHGFCDDDDSDYGELSDYLTNARKLNRSLTTLTNHLAIDPTDNPE